MSETTNKPGVRSSVVSTQIKKPRNQYVMVKNYSGGLSVQLESFDYTMPLRQFNFRFNVEKIYIPSKYALGVFVTPDALTMMERGYFTFENLQELIEEAEALGYYVPEAIKNPKVTNKEIRALLREGDIEKMKKEFLNITDKVKRDVVDIAKAIYSNLNMEVVNWIENTFEVSLKPINLDE